MRDANPLFNEIEVKGSEELPKCVSIFCLAQVASVLRTGSAPLVSEVNCGGISSFVEEANPSVLESTKGKS